MVLIETVGQKSIIRDFETLRPKIENLRLKETQENEISRLIQTPPRFRDWNKNLRDPEFSGFHSPPLLFNPKFLSKLNNKSRVKTAYNTDPPGSG